MAFNYTYSGKRIADIPQDPRDRQFLGDIDRQTKVDIDERFGIVYNQDWLCNTVANNTIESIITALKTDMETANAPRATINFYNLFVARTSTRRNKKAEKEGNINIAFEPGPDAEALISSTVPKNQEEVVQVKPIEFFHIEDEELDEKYVAEMNAAYLQVDQHARYSLSGNYGIVIPDEMVCFAITYTFIKNIFIGLLQELGENPEQNLVSVNFNDNIEFHAERKADNEVLLTMRPGMNAKLLIKSDQITEEEEYDVSPGAFGKL